MPLCVRKIDSKRLWDDPTPPELTWLGVRDLRADALRDLRTDDNALSIWEIDNESGISLPRILAALAANRDNLARLDFIVFDFGVIQRLGIAFERVEGTTLDAGVNTRHMNLTQLTAGALSGFGAGIRADGEVNRYHYKKVKQLIRESIDQQFLNSSQLKPGVAMEIR